MHALAAHREVSALDERQAQIAREVGVFEVGLVVWAGRQQHDARRVGTPGSERGERIAHRLEPARESRDVEAAEDLRQHAGGDDAVFQRIARAGGRLRAVGEHPPLAIG